MQYASLDVGDDDQHSSVGLVYVSNIFVMQGDYISMGSIFSTFDKVYVTD